MKANIFAVPIHIFSSKIFLQMFENFPKNRIGLFTTIAQLVERSKFKNARYLRREGNVLNSSPNGDNLCIIKKCLVIKNQKEEKKKN